MKKLVVALEEDTHRRLKIRAAEEGRSMTDLITRLIDLELSKTAVWADKDQVWQQGKATLHEVSVQKEVVNPDWVMKGPVDATKTVKPSTAKRPMPDLSKAAQVKGRMGK